MQSVYHCKKCSIDFPTVTRYIKHRKLFCELGRGGDDADESIPEDGIGKLTIAEASKRISRIVELKMKEVDPTVYDVVDQLQKYKSKRRQDCKRVSELRAGVLKRISDLKVEMKDLETAFTQKNKRYESIKAYSQVSAIEVRGTEELVRELHDLRSAIVYLEDEISANIDTLHKIETGEYKQDMIPTKPGTVPSKSSTRERIHLPALPAHTPSLTPGPASAGADVIPSPAPSEILAVESVMRHSRATTVPHRSPLQDNDIERDVNPLKPGTADSVVLLGKLQRRREILSLQKEIRAMEEEGQDTLKEDVLADMALLPYTAHDGVAVYIDYLTPTFHISANLVLAVLKSTTLVSQLATFVVTSATHLTFLGYHEIFPNLAPSNDVYLYASIQTLEGEELGWCLFNLFSEGTLNSGAWRVPLKSPPFTQDLVSTLYHGARSLNYSLRLRCSLPSVHESMLSSQKLKLAQYKFHNPAFQDNLILTSNLNKFEKKHKMVRTKSLERVAETYGPPGDFDPIKVLRKGGSKMRLMPPALKAATPPPKTTTPDPTPEVQRTPTPPTTAPPGQRLKGLHYHTLVLNHPNLPPSLSLHTHYCEIDEEYHILGKATLPPSTPAKQRTIIKHYFFDYQTLELPWKQDDVVFLFSFMGGRQNEDVVCWSWAKYSDKEDELEVFKPPVPSFTQLVQEIEKRESGRTSNEERFTKLPNSSFLVRYYDIKEHTPSFPVRPDGFFRLPQPRLPTGAFRHVDQKANFTLHDTSRSITLVIDGARYLPSCVTVSRVTGRIFDRNFDIVGPQISSSVVLDSDVYNPIYKYSVNVPGDLPSTSVAVLKIYTLHAVTGQLTTIGYSLLNLFCKRGTILPAEAKDSSNLVLTEGAQQLPIHVDGPDAGQPLKMDALQGVYCIPCSWLLVRLFYTPEDGAAAPLMPSYNDGLYADHHVNLSTTETFVLDSHRQRPIKPGNKVCPFDSTTIPIVKKLTRHKGQTVGDMSPSDILEYSPEFGVGVKLVGIKNFRRSSGTVFLYLRLCTYEAMYKFTDHMLYNECVQFNIDDRIKWTDQVHYFKHVIPSTDVFVLVQILDYKNEYFSTVGWLKLPIFAHTGALNFVKKTSRSEIPLTLGSPDPAMLADPEDMRSTLDAEADVPYVVVEIFDSRYSSESKTVSYEVDPEYVKLAEEGMKFIATEQSGQRNLNH